MKKTEFDREEMKRLWEKQSRALEGQKLISDDEIRRAMSQTPRPAVRPMYVWRRVAAVAVVLIVAAVAVWQWPAQPAQNQQSILRVQNNQKIQNNQHIPIIPNTPKTPTLLAEPPAQRGGESLEESLMEELPEMVAPVAVEELADDELLVAQAPAPQQTVWPNRQATTDTLTVYTTRLVQYDTPKRKSLTETIFEPVLASL